MTLPAGSISIAGGVFSAPVWLAGRWAYQMLSFESTATPTTLPTTSSPGSGLGHDTSYWNAGTAGLAGAVIATCCDTTTASATIPTTTETLSARFMLPSPLYRVQP